MQLVSKSSYTLNRTIEFGTENLRNYVIFNVNTLVPFEKNTQVDDCVQNLSVHSGLTPIRLDKFNLHDLYNFENLMYM